MSASVSKSRKGYRIDFRFGAVKSSIRLGSKISKRECSAFASRLSTLIAIRSTGGTLDAATQKWLDGLPNSTLEKLVKIGVCESRQKDRSLVSWLSDYFQKHGYSVSASDGAKAIWRRSIAMAEQFFGSKKMLRSVTSSDATDFRIWLLQQPGQGDTKMAEATVRKRCSNLSQAYREAVHLGLVASNPFTRVPKAGTTNPDREQFVPPEDVEALISMSGDPEEKMLLALSRFAALRIPTEIKELRWGDFDVQTNLLSVKSPKTKRHGKASRLIPVDVRLRELLIACKPAGAAADDYVLPSLRLHSNPRMVVLRLQQRSKTKTWHKVFHALRASCITEWGADHPLPEVAEWSGHTVAVAVKYYQRAKGIEHLQKVARAMATKGGCGAGCGNAAPSALPGVVAPVVTAAAATNGQDGSSPAQSPAAYGIVTGADESSLLVGVPHQQVVSRSNGRYWTTDPA